MKLPIFANHDEMVNIFVAVEISIINYFALVNNNLRKNKKYRLQTAYKIRIYNYGVLKLIRNYKRMKIYYTDYEYEISCCFISLVLKGILTYFANLQFYSFYHIYKRYFWFIAIYCNDWYYQKKQYLIQYQISSTL